jgi:hypothetical protein
VLRDPIADKSAAEPSPERALTGTIRSVGRCRLSCVVRWDQSAQRSTLFKTTTGSIPPARAVTTSRSMRPRFGVRSNPTTINATSTFAASGCASGAAPTRRRMSTVFRERISVMATPSFVALERRTQSPITGRSNACCAWCVSRPETVARDCWVHSLEPEPPSLLANDSRGRPVFSGSVVAQCALLPRAPAEHIESFLRIRQSNPLSTRNASMPAVLATAPPSPREPRHKQTSPSKALTRPLLETPPLEGTHSDCRFTFGGSCWQVFGLTSGALWPGLLPIASLKHPLK